MQFNFTMDLFIFVHMFFHILFDFLVCGTALCLRDISKFLKVESVYT